MMEQPPLHDKCGRSQSWLIQPWPSWISVGRQMEGMSSIFVSKMWKVLRRREVLMGWMCLSAMILSDREKPCASILKRFAAIIVKSYSAIHALRESQKELQSMLDRKSVV